MQRFGRTGRQRDGAVHVLLAEDREEFNVERARASYEEVQQAMFDGSQIELYADVERLLPDHITPQCLEKEMPVTPYVPEPRYSRKTDTEATNGSKSKRKRNADVQRNVPALACMGFIRASDLTGKSSKKRKTTEPDLLEEEKDFDMQGIDDDTDKELESGMILAAPRRTKSSAASTSKSKTEKKTRVRRAATHDGGSKNVKSKKKPDKAKFFQLGADDSDDPDIKSPPKTPKKKKGEGSKEGTSRPTKFSEASLKRAKRVTRQQPNPSPTDAVINITDSEQDAVELTTSHPPSTSQHISDDLSWVVQDDDEMDIDIASPSPLAVKSKAEVPSQIMPSSLSPQVRGTKMGKQWSNDCNEPVEKLQCRDQGGQLRDSFTEEPMGRNGVQPDFSVECITSSSPGLPIATFPVQRAGKGRSKNTGWDANVNVNIESSPREEVPLKRLQRQSPSSTPARKKKKQKVTAFEAQDNPLFDVVANHSGDEVSQGGSDSEDYVETEFDRAFIKNSPLTQAPGSYDQSQVYRQSLFTQVPGNMDMPEFAQGPSRPNLFRRQRARQVIQPSSSPVRGSDDYEFGSFVVRDDAEISFEV